jgi:hypothetical protein
MQLQECEDALNDKANGKGRTCPISAPPTRTMGMTCYTTYPMSIMTPLASYATLCSLDP